jgi:hypothetical protein
MGREGIDDRLGTEEKKGRMRKRSDCWERE